MAARDDEAEPSTLRLESLEDTAVGGAPDRTPAQTGVDIEGEQARALVRARLFGSRPATIGRYQVQGRLGAGAMGVVYRARDPSLARDVAVKVMHPGRVDERRRLLDEARSLARVNHPNVVQIYEADTHGEQVFIAMELVEGTPMDAWILTRPSLSQALEATLGAGRGLAAAHAAGVVHRDFKPANVLIGRDGRARVLDFGLAVDYPRSSSTEDVPMPRNEGHPTGRLTATGAIAGTPAYLAPERWEGAVADARSDQWAYAVTVWEACAGNRPFRATSIHQLYQAIVARPPRLDTSGLPRWLVAILERGLQRNPVRRFPSVPHLIAAMERGRRRPRRTGAVALGLAMLGVAWGFGSTRQPPCRDVGTRDIDAVWNPARREAVARVIQSQAVPDADAGEQRITASLNAAAQAWLATRRETCEATMLRHEDSPALMDQRRRCLQRRLDELDATLKVILGKGPVAVGRAEQAVDALLPPRGCLDPGNRLVPPPALLHAVGRLEARLARADALYQIGGQPRDAMSASASVVDEARELGYAPLLASALRSLGAAQHEAGEVERARSTLLEAFALADRAGDDRVAYDIARWLVIVSRTRRSPSDAATWARTARARFDRIGTTSPRRTAAMHMLMGDVHWLEGHDAATMAAYEAAVTAAREVEDGKATIVAHALHNVATVHMRRGRFDEAAETLREAVSIYEANLGPDHVEVATTLQLLGGAQHEGGDSRQARETLERARTIFAHIDGYERAEAELLVTLGYVQGMLGENDAALADLERAVALLERVEDSEVLRAAALTNLAGIYNRLGRPDNAITVLERARVLDQEAAQAGLPRAAQRLVNLGMLHIDNGAPQKGLQELEQAELIYRAFDGPPRPELAVIADARGVALAALGDREGQRAAHGLALKIIEETLGTEHPRLVEILRHLGDAEDDAGDHAAALEHRERAVRIAEAGDVRAARLGQLRFALARSLWHRGRERDRARVLAEQARSDFASASEDVGHEARAVEVWLQTHRLR